MVTILDPAHPFCGRTLPVERVLAVHGEQRLVVRLPRGGRRSVRRGATDADGPGAPASAAGLPRVSARTLLLLARLVAAMLRAEEEAPHAHPARSAADAPPARPAARGPAPAAVAVAAGGAAAATGPGGGGPAPPAVARGPGEGCGR